MDRREFVKLIISEESVNLTKILTREWKGSCVGMKLLTFVQNYSMPLFRSNNSNSNTTTYTHSSSNELSIHDV